jgi:hypothetical protein
VARSRYGLEPFYDKPATAGELDFCSPAEPIDSRTTEAVNLGRPQFLESVPGVC